MSTTSRLLQLGALASLVALTSCAEDETTEFEATGLALSIEGEATDDVAAFDIAVNAVSCRGGAVDVFSAGRTVELENQTLPGVLEGEGAGPYDGDSSHAFADAFFVVPTGCYDIVAQPVTIADPETGERSISAHCAAAYADGVEVVDGHTTEVHLVSQCDGDGSTGGLDAALALNHAPSITDFTYDPSKFITECELATFCVEATDPDDDPLEVWFGPDGAAGLGLAYGPEEISYEMEPGYLHACYQVAFDDLGDLSASIMVRDLLRVDGEARPFDDYYAERGQTETSRGTLEVPFHVEPDIDFFCVNDEGEVVHLPGVREMARAEGCTYDTPAAHYCAGAQADTVCPDEVFDPWQVYEACGTDLEPPIIRLERPFDDEIIRGTNDQLIIAGYVSEAMAEFVLDGTPEELDALRFERTVTLMPGENVITFSGRDLSNNRLSDSVTVYYEPLETCGEAFDETLDQLYDQMVAMASVPEVFDKDFRGFLPEWLQAQWEQMTSGVADTHLAAHEALFEADAMCAVGQTSDGFAALDRAYALVNAPWREFAAVYWQTLPYLYPVNGSTYYQPFYVVTAEQLAGATILEGELAINDWAAHSNVERLAPVIESDGMALVGELTTEDDERINEVILTDFVVIDGDLTDLGNGIVEGTDLWVARDVVAEFHGVHLIRDAIIFNRLDNPRFAPEILADENAGVGDYRSILKAATRGPCPCADLCTYNCGMGELLVGGLNELVADGFMCGGGGLVEDLFERPTRGEEWVWGSWLNREVMYGAVLWTDGRLNAVRDFGHAAPAASNDGINRFMLGVVDPGLTELRAAGQIGEVCEAGRVGSLIGPPGMCRGSCTPGYPVFSGDGDPPVRDPDRSEFCWIPNTCAGGLSCPQGMDFPYGDFGERRDTPNWVGCSVGLCPSSGDCDCDSDFSHGPIEDLNDWMHGGTGDANVCARADVDCPGDEMIICRGNGGGCVACNTFSGLCHHMEQDMSAYHEGELDPSLNDGMKCVRLAGGGHSCVDSDGRSWVGGLASIDTGHGHRDEPTVVRDGTRAVQDAGHTAEENPAQTSTRETPMRSTGGDPVILANGEFTMSVTDLEMPGDAQMLTRMTRVYRSEGDFVGAMGMVWEHGFEEEFHMVRGSAYSTVNYDVLRTQLLYNPPDYPEYCYRDMPMVNCIDHRGGQGGHTLYMWDTATQSYLPGGTAQGVIAAPETVDWRSDGSPVLAFHYRDARGMVTTFNEDGEVLRKVDLSGNVVSYSYEPSPQAGRLELDTETDEYDFVSTDNLLTRVTDDRGQSFDLEYGAFDLVTAVSDPSGRRMEYCYELAIGPTEEWVMAYNDAATTNAREALLAEIMLSPAELELDALDECEDCLWSDISAYLDPLPGPELEARQALTEEIAGGCYTVSLAPPRYEPLITGIHDVYREDFLGLWIEHLFQRNVRGTRGRDHGRSLAYMHRACLVPSDATAPDSCGRPGKDAPEGLEITQYAYSAAPFFPEYQEQLIEEIQRRIGDGYFDEWLDALGIAVEDRERWKACGGMSSEGAAGGNIRGGAILQAQLGRLTTVSRRMNNNEPNQGAAVATTESGERWLVLVENSYNWIPGHPSWGRVVNQRSGGYMSPEDLWAPGINVSDHELSSTWSEPLDDGGIPEDAMLTSLPQSHFEYGEIQSAWPLHPSVVPDRFERLAGLAGQAPTDSLVHLSELSCADTASDVGAHWADHLHVRYPDPDSETDEVIEVTFEGYREAQGHALNAVCSFARVTYPDGRVVASGLNYAGQTLIERTMTDRTARYYTYRSYNAEGMLVDEQVVLADPGETGSDTSADERVVSHTSYVFDSESANIFSRRNLLSRTEHAGPTSNLPAEVPPGLAIAGGSEAATVTDHWTYERLSQRVLTHTTAVGQVITYVPEYMTSHAAQDEVDAHLAYFGLPTVCDPESELPCFRVSRTEYAPEGGAFARPYVVAIEHPGPDDCGGNRIVTRFTYDGYGNITSRQRGFDDAEVYVYGEHALGSPPVELECAVLGDLLEGEPVEDLGDDVGDEPRRRDRGCYAPPTGPARSGQGGSLRWATTTLTLSDVESLSDGHEMGWLSNTDLETEFGYDEFGRLSTVDEPGVGRTEIAYDGRGWIRAVIAPSGLVTTYQRDGIARVVATDTHLSEGAGGGGPHVVTRIFRGPDAAPLLTCEGTQCVGDARGLFDELPGAHPDDVVSGDPDVATAPHQVQAIWSDAMARPTLVAHADGTQTRWTYNGFGLVTERETCPAGSPLDPTSTCAGQGVSLDYDAMGQATSFTLTGTDSETIATQLGYDGFGRLVYVANNVPTGSEATATLSAWRGLLNNGALEETRLLAGGDVLSQVLTRDGSGRVQRMTSTSGGIDHWLQQTYDCDGRTASMTMDTGYGINTIHYHGDGSLAYMEDTLGNSAGQGWQLDDGTFDRRSFEALTDPDGRDSYHLITRVQHDPLGRPSVVSRHSAGELYAHESLVYDPWGRLQSRWSAVNPAESIAFSSTEYAYDAMGRLLSVSEASARGDASALDRVTSYVHTLGGGLRSVTDPGGDATTMEYDAFGRLSTRQEPGPHADEDLHYEIEYDALGRLRHVYRGTDPDELESFQYWRYYAGSWLPEAVAFGPGSESTVQFRSYDPMGRPTQLARTEAGLDGVEGLEVITDLSYDTLGELLGDTTTVQGRTFGMDFMPDSEGRFDVASFLDGTPFVSAAGYSSSGLLDDIAFDDGELVADFGYVGGRALQRTISDHEGDKILSREAHLDPLGRVDELRQHSRFLDDHGTPGHGDDELIETNLLQHMRRLGPDGRVVADWLGREGELGRARYMAYTGTGELEAMREVEGVGYTASTAPLAELGSGVAMDQVVENAENGQVYRYARNAIGSLVSETLGGGGADDPTSWTATRDGRVSTQIVASGTRPDGTELGLDAELTWDDVGRLTHVRDSDGGILDITWSADDLPVIVETRETREIRTYDALGRMVVLETLPLGVEDDPETPFDERLSTVVDRTYWGQQLVREASDCGQRVWFQTPELDRPVAYRVSVSSTCDGDPGVFDIDPGLFHDDEGNVIQESFTYFPIQDMHGDVVAIVDETGDTLESYSYDVYGVRTVTYSDGTSTTDRFSRPARSEVGNTLGYAGAFTMPSGLSDMRARQYDPHLRTFLSPDPLGYIDGYDRWQYVGGDPLSQTDPFGLSAMPTSGYQEDPMLSHGFETPMNPGSPAGDGGGRQVGSGYAEPSPGNDLTFNLPHFHIGFHWPGMGGGGDDDPVAPANTPEAAPDDPSDECDGGVGSDSQDPLTKEWEEWTKSPNRSKEDLQFVSTLPEPDYGPASPSNVDHELTDEEYGSAYDYANGIFGVMDAMSLGLTNVIGLTDAADRSSPYYTGGYVAGSVGLVVATWGYGTGMISAAELFGVGSRYVALGQAMRSGAFFYGVGTATTGILAGGFGNPNQQTGQNLGLFTGWMGPSSSGLATIGVGALLTVVIVVAYLHMTARCRAGG